MGRPLIAHYGAEWVELYNETTAGLQRLFATTGTVFVFVGSGTTCLDAGANALLKPGDTAIVGVNGFFGERLVAIAESYGARVVPVDAEWGTAFEPGAFAAALDAKPDAAAVLVVHNETSTGVLNPVEEIAATVRGRDVPLMVDAITSLGGERFVMDGWGIDIAVTASQKCLGAPPGLGAIAVSDRAWSLMEKRPPVGFMANLLVWRDYKEKWSDWHPFPATMAVGNVRALRRCVLRILEQGIDVRIEQHAGAARFVRERLRATGFDLPVGDAEASHAVTLVRCPPGQDSPDLIGWLKDKHGIQIANALGKFKDRCFRIGHMGEVGTKKETLEPLLAAIEQYGAGRAPA
jgi:alanine-glyoxylate transaminase/serine-glyoxylate transaminase/serine-pyruvate transaminase